MKYRELVLLSLLLLNSNTTFHFINITADRDVRTEISILYLLEYPALRPLLPFPTIYQTTQFVIEWSVRVRREIISLKECRSYKGEYKCHIKFAAFECDRLSGFTPWKGPLSSSPLQGREYKQVESLASIQYYWTVEFVILCNVSVAFLWVPAKHFWFRGILTLHGP